MDSNAQNRIKSDTALLKPLPEVLKEPNTEKYYGFKCSFRAFEFPEVLNLNFQIFFTAR